MIAREWANDVHHYCLPTPLSKLQSLNSKPCVPFSNLGYFTVCYEDALSLSAGSLQPNGAEKEHAHMSKIKRMLLKSHYSLNNVHVYEPTTVYIWLIFAM